MHDEKFLEATVEEMLTDIWAHRYREDPKLLTDYVEDDDFDPDMVAQELGLPPDDDFEDL